MRLDKYLVTQKNIRSRSHALDLIKNGKVLVEGNLVLKPALEISNQKVEVLEEEAYVGRGAHKLKQVVDWIEIKDKVLLDGGASTGGFTQILLEENARKIYALDVGHGQLHPSLKENPKVENREGLNLKESFELPELVDAAVLDLSFISLKLVLPNIFSALRPGGPVIVLFKPQFETERSQLNSQGIVKSPEINKEILDHFISWCQEQEIEIKKSVECLTRGKKGNQEFLLLLVKK